VADPLWIHTRVALAGEFHQVDAAARRIHFFVPEDVRGTDRQAKAAMDTVFDDLFGRRVVRVEGAWQWISFGNGGHGRALLAVTREHNRTTVLLANSGRGEKEREKKDTQKITQKRPDPVGVNAEHRAT
jgi:hypothetical protein